MRENHVNAPRSPTLSSLGQLLCLLFYVASSERRRDWESLNIGVLNVGSNDSGEEVDVESTLALNGERYDGAQEATDQDDTKCLIGTWYYGLGVSHFHIGRSPSGGLLYSETAKDGTQFVGSLEAASTNSGVSKQWFQSDLKLHLQYDESYGTLVSGSWGALYRPEDLLERFDDGFQQDADIPQRDQEDARQAEDAARSLIESVSQVPELPQIIAGFVRKLGSDTSAERKMAGRVLNRFMHANPSTEAVNTVNITDVIVRDIDVRGALGTILGKVDQADIGEQLFTLFQSRVPEEFARVTISAVTTTLEAGELNEM